MPQRSTSSGSYRYGFNGKENDNEVKGAGNQQDYGMRIYEPRLGKFLSVDPITKDYPELTPYQFASNSPIFGIDLDGTELIGNNWIYDIWLDWKFGDPTGAKRFKSGAEKKIAIENGLMPYHNTNVPENTQNQLDHINNIDANRKLAAGTVQYTKFILQTWAEISLLFVPIESSGVRVTQPFNTPFKNSVVNETTELMFRVQGGGSKTRFIVDESAKKVSISGDDMLFVNFGQESRAIEFLAQRGDDAVILKMKIDKKFVDKIRAEAVPQREGRLYPGNPQVVDPSKAKDQFGLPKKYFEGLLKSIEEGSIEIIKKGNE
jgi:RHS repeat-associated protein